MNVDELKHELLSRGLRPTAASFQGGILSAPEQYCITNENGIWEVYYYERGNKNALKQFVDESAACEDLRARLLRDKTAWLPDTHSADDGTVNRDMS